MAGGTFITFEGCDGSGKTAQAKLLADALISLGRDVLLTREPGGSPGAELIRTLLVTGATRRWDGRTEALLHYAARRDHVINNVKPALKKSKVVISDRFADSTVAYQGHGYGLSIKDIEKLHEITLANFQPDLTFILDLPVEIGLQRAMRRGGPEDRYERMDISFHNRIRAGFLSIAEMNPNRCFVINADRKVATIHADILEISHQRLQKAH